MRTYGAIAYPNAEGATVCGLAYLGNGSNHLSANLSAFSVSELRQRNRCKARSLALRVLKGNKTLWCERYVKHGAISAYYPHPLTNEIVAAKITLEKVSDLLANETLWTKTDRVLKVEVRLWLEPDARRFFETLEATEGRMTLFQTQHGSDMTIKLQDGSPRPVHRAVLLRRLPMFRQPTFQKETELDWSGFTVPAVDAMLRYLYEVLDKEDEPFPYWIIRQRPADAISAITLANFLLLDNLALLIISNISSAMCRTHLRTFLQASTLWCKADEKGVTTMGLLGTRLRKAVEQAVSTEPYYLNYVLDRFERHPSPEPPLDASSPAPGKKRPSSSSSSSSSSACSSKRARTDN